MSEMDVDAKKRKKDAKKEKKLKKERKKEKAARAAASSTRGGLEEVYEDEIEVSMMGHTNQQYKGDPHDHIGLNDDQHISIDDDGGVVDSHRKVRSELSSSRPNGGAEVDEEIDLDAELMEEMAANEADLDLDYHPPPPKTTQQIAIAGVLLLLLGVIELLLFGYLSTPIDVWSLVTSGSILVMNGILGIRAAHDNTIVKAYHYRFSLQVYMVLIVMLSTINIVILNVQPCIAPCVSTKACVQPFGATDTCARVLVNTIAISAFGLFFPLFLFCLPCYLGSRIHIENLESQFNAAGPKSTPPYSNQHHSETRSNYRNQEDERKY